MASKTSPEIDEAIKFIHKNIYEPITLSDLSKHVAYSPYHFIRVFKEKMGLSPLYYVSSLRLQKAKDLLLHTHLSIRDIGLEIGQQSLGTFTTRFTDRVGMTPSEFRNAGEQTDKNFSLLRKFNRWESPSSHAITPGTIKGTIKATIPFKGMIFIGLFPKPIPERLPPYGTVLSSEGDFCFRRVRPGRYYLMATSIDWQMGTTDIMLPDATLRTRSRNPIDVRPDHGVPHLEVMLYPPRLDDPPILVSLPLLMHRFLQRINQEAINK
ncbi:helix-turn-helix transcriptional regulator [Camelliibacillus cellulosilyticus]|uniref:Helix-turn-helix transcriptional regulator n=1 Tax=Camelliibacillus cellulosilyticus TaxID=2174486 RepID=A0ABV9GPV0_9BACL